MPHPRSHLTTALNAYRRIARDAEHADRTLPTRLTGWSIGNLIDHVAWASLMEASAIRIAAGQAQSMGVGNAPDAAAADATALERSVDAFREAILIPVEDRAPVTLPAGTVPMEFAAALFAFEAALHSSDLAAALGRPARLSQDELVACQLIIGPLLDRTAAKVPPLGTVIDLLGMSEQIRLRSTGEGWIRDSGETDSAITASTTITGCAEQLVLFVCGRLGADVSRMSELTVEGEFTHAAEFKRYFVGP